MSLDDETRGDIEALRTNGDVAETPEGRMVALGEATRVAYENIHTFVRAGPGDCDRVGWEGELWELWEVLIDIGKRVFDDFVGAPVGLRVWSPEVPVRPGRGVVSELQRRRYPPDGDVDRWVREGSPGRVDYEGGPVPWAPGAVR